MPKSVVRLSAGRLDLSLGDQAMAFLAGANSIFDGDKLLTTANNDRDEDMAMFSTLGLKSRPAFLPYQSGNTSSRSFDEPAAVAGSSCGGGCGSAVEQKQATAGAC